MLQIISEQTIGIYDALIPMYLGTQVQWTEGRNEDFTSSYLKAAEKFNTLKSHQFRSNIVEFEGFLTYETRQGYIWTGSKNISNYYSCYYGELCAVSINKLLETWLERKNLSDFVSTRSSPRFSYSPNLISLSFFGPREIQINLNTLKWWVEKVIHYVPSLYGLPPAFKKETILPLDASHEQGILGFMQRNLSRDQYPA